MLARGKMAVRQALLTMACPRLLRPRSGIEKRLATRPSIDRIMVVRPDHLGDLLFATPAIERLREAFPQSRIAGAVGPWGRAMWQYNPSLNSLDVMPFPGITASRRRGLLAPYRLLRLVARRLAGRYDLGIVLRFDYWWGAALLAATGVPRRWGYDLPGMARWLTTTLPYRPGRHEVVQNLELVEAVIEACASEEDRSRLGPLLVDRERGLPSLRPPSPAAPEPPVAEGWKDAPRRAIIHPGTTAANKLWTVGGWAEVARRLSQQGYEVALTGAAGEAKLCEAIEEGTAENPPLNLAGQTESVQELAWLFERAHMVLGVDSGPLHIAAALGRPTLHLYGPSDERIWGPWGDPNSHRAFRAPGTVSTGRLEIGSRRLDGGPEMKAITVDMVMGEIDALERAAGLAVLR